MNMLVYFRYLVPISLFWVKLYGFNVDTRTATVYSHPERTRNHFFGFTVALHADDVSTWLLVGAPLTDAFSSNGTLLAKYGGIFKCKTNGSKACVYVDIDKQPERKEAFPAKSGNEVTMETKSGQWLGATLKSDNGTVLVCSPRYSHKNQDRYQSHSFAEGLPIRPWLSGRCYLLYNNLTIKDHRGIVSPWDGSKSSYTGNSQAGFSATLMDGGVLMGTVGRGFPPNNKGRPLNWAGGVTMLSLSSNAYKSTSRDELEGHDYVGYDVASGFGSSKDDIVSGAPRGNKLRGKVVLYDTQENDGIVFKSQLKVPDEVQEKRMKKTTFGAYFGSTLCSVDLNNDGLTDLLVGAPLFTDTMDEGRVYIYMNKMGILTLTDTILKGDNLKGARFGTAIADVGDLNLDGYQDVVIGAPYEGHNKSGAVYVYYGSVTGIEAHYRQKISGKSVDKKLQGFGFSISGKIDVDRNAFPDIAVGSYLSGHAVLLRTRWIVVIRASIRPDRNRIVLDNNNFSCRAEDGSLNKCLNLTVCFRYQDREPFDRQGVDISFDMEADKDITPLEYRRAYFYNGKDKTFTVRGTATLPSQGNEHCLAPYRVYISDKIRFLDLLKELTFDLKFSLADRTCESVPNRPCPILDDYQPNEVRNDEVMFQKQCSGEICRPDLSITAHVQLSGSHTVLVVGAKQVLTVHIEIENLAEDASYQTAIRLYFPVDLDYVGPTNTRNVPCSSHYSNNTRLATCQIGNPFTPKTKKSVSIEFNAEDIKNDFVMKLLVTSASNDSNQANNMVSLPISTKYLSDMSMIGDSQPREVIYNGKSFSRTNMTGPLITQTITVLNHGPSFVDGAVATVQVPKLYDSNDPDNTLLSLNEVEVAEGSGKCIQMNNTWQAVMGQSISMFCQSDACYSLECQLGRLQMGRRVKISLTLRLHLDTFIQTNSETELITAAQVRVQPNIIQNDVSNDNVKITLTIRPSSEAPEEELSTWVVLVSTVSGLALFAGLVLILFKCGFFVRSRPKKRDDSMNEEDTPMKG